MFKRKTCPNCLTGAKSYELDKLSPLCPYLACHTGRSCPYYKPLKVGRISLFINKLRGKNESTFQ